MSSPSPDQAHSFGAVADVYEHGRPGYPAEAARWLVPAGATRVVDLGAGTGKFTRTLVPLGAEVIAVEPDAGMRAQLSRSVPGIEVLDGSGESIPLGDGTADAVTVAQAWHWMDPELASAEVARVLRPGGVLGLVWNIRDERVPWVMELSRILARPEAHVIEAERPRVLAPFGALEEHIVSWVHEQDRAAFLDLVASRSYVITMEPGDRATLLAAVEDLLDHTPELAGHDTIPVPYRTYCHRAVRP
jgi:SAM-dependent methyltransferase